ncbi:MAG: type IV toxin-antitoxin system AbiEi family antitoxin [Acidobacteriota bacterium]
MNRHWLENLRKLPFLRANVEAPTTKDPADGVLLLRTPRKTHRLLLEEKRGHLTAAAAVLALQDMRKAAPRGAWILVAPFVGPDVGARLAEAKVNYADGLGNCHVVLETDYVAHVEGRRPPTRPARDKGTHAQGYLVMFALLAQPELANETVRRIAGVAGVGKTTVAGMLAKLDQEGVLVRRRKGRQLLDEKGLMDRWLAAYPNALRPFLLVGRYRAPDRDPGQVEARIERGMPDGLRWAWGGGAAAMRLTKYYRGERTVIHVTDPPPDLDRRLGLLRADDGNIVILRAPCKLMLDGPVPGTAHPLLVYVELMTEGGDRAREAAGVVAEKLLARRT